MPGAARLALALTPHHILGTLEKLAINGTLKAQAVVYLQLGLNCIVCSGANQHGSVQ